jgi:hypothetical protein
VIETFYILSEAKENFTLVSSLLEWNNRKINRVLFLACDWLGAGRPRGRSSTHGSVKNFLHIVQTGSGAHPACYPMATGGSFPRGKAAGE